VNVLRQLLSCLQQTLGNKIYMRIFEMMIADYKGELTHEQKMAIGYLIRDIKSLEQESKRNKSKGRFPGFMG